MGDIIDNEEIDRDTVQPEALEQLFNSRYTLLTETRVTHKNAYVNKVNGSRSLQIAVGISVNNSIEVYDLQKTSLHKVCGLSGHCKGLTEVVFSPKEDQQLYSTGLDGTIRLWDLRAGGSCAQEYKDAEEIGWPFDCMDVSCNGRVLCAGTQLMQDEANLVFWDQRMPKPLGGYWNSHTDDITQVKFHKDKTEIVTSGSLDGLLNVYNVLEQTEDDALTYSLNIENSVERITWLDEKQVACITQCNDVQIWDTESGDLVKSYHRDKVAKSIKRSKGDDCYVVDTFKSDRPIILAGSNGGDGTVLRSVSVTEKKLVPDTNFVQNKQIVRDCWYHKDRNILVTTGEEGLVSAWAAADGRA